MMNPRACLAILFAAFGSIAPADVAAQSVANRPETVRLDPFEVSASSDTSYGALNSNSITQFSAELAHLPISADIFDQAFMKDVSETSVEDMIETYSAGAGFSGADPGAVASTSQPGDRTSNAFLQLRGLINPGMQRDSFLPVNSTAIGLTNNFDLENVQVINGPQALLYGNGGAGGVINLTSKQARIGQPAFGSEAFRIDQFGSKRNLFDYGASRGNFALRLDVLNEVQDSRRINIGSNTQGLYGQIAWRVGNTTIRIEGERTANHRIDSHSQSVTGATTATTAYPYNGDSLHYLLAAGLGPQIDNGELNWSNVDSYVGNWEADRTVNKLGTLTADSIWNSWLSTQVDVGYETQLNQQQSPQTISLYTPDASANPYPGSWTMGFTGGTEPLQDYRYPYREKALRVSALASNDFFGGSAHNQLILGADFERTDNGNIHYAYYQADSNFIPVGGGTAANAGRLVMPKQYWTVNQGPVFYALPWKPSQPEISIAGVNYVRMLENPIATANVTPQNPLGVSVPGGGSYDLSEVINKGIYGVNYTQWDDKKLDTLFGFRLADSYKRKLDQDADAAGDAISLTQSDGLFSFSTGADYSVNSWLHPYFTVSDSFDPPVNEDNDPDGNLPKTAHALGEEVGVKIANESGTISGSLAVYHVSSKNEEYEITTTLVLDINPTGINGRFGTPTTWINVNRVSQGVQAILTAAPNPNWRMRLSAAWTGGTINSSTSYAQLYNDQFHENAAGQVTFADGSVVYVAPTYNSKATSVYAGPGPAGTTPLTVQLLGSLTSPYYINPNLVSGSIGSASTAYTILTGGALNEASLIQAHGSIGTGATGLPISSLQVPVAGETIPGNIVTSNSGDNTTGYPVLSFNFTNVYTVPSGWLKGFRFGGTVMATWEQRDFYYYPTSLNTPTSPRALFYDPTLWREDLILGYSRKLKHVVFSTQLNVYNLFNRYDILILPNEITGWTAVSGLNAKFDQQPRAYVWTNTINF